MNEPLGTNRILRAEAKEIHGPDALTDETTRQPVPDGNLNRQLGTLESTALCLSGGGIRSASFALGVIQALAGWPARSRSNQDRPFDPPGSEHALLGQFNYLSTVSGGGYIGGWLSAWLKRESYAKVLAALTSRDGSSGGSVGGVEPPPIGDLRRYGNYLTPKVGLLSADSWAAAAMVVRNLLLNWLLQLPLFLLSILAVKLLMVLVAAPGWSGHSGARWFGPLSASLLALLMVLAAVAALSVSQRLPFNQRSRWGAAQPRPDENRTLPQKSVIRYSLVPAVAAGLLGTALLNGALAADSLPSELCLIGLGALIGVPAFGAARLFGRWKSGQFKDAPPSITDLRHRKSWAWLAAGASYGALLGLGAHLLVPAFDPATRLPDPLDRLLLALFGLPWFLMSQMAAETVYIALTSASPHTDEQREWFARSAGWYMAAGTFWILGICLTLLGSLALALALADWRLPLDLSTAGGAVTAVVGWLTGTSSRTPARGAAKGPTGKLYSALAILAATLFFGLLLVLGSAWIDWVALGRPLVGFPEELFHRLELHPVESAGGPAALGHLLLVSAILGLVAWIASRYVNINRFSLHGLYRNRLVRAFLGASNPRRNPDRFTGFDMTDNLPMACLWPPERMSARTGADWKPFHILNLTLNLVSSRDLAWQQRKAMSFTVSPLHSGAAALRPQPDEAGIARTGYLGAYRPSDVYGGASHPRRHYLHQGGEPAGITLGTAMAISGAAVNPNMGYHSSPVVTLLLTLLNVRLGWWLGNPGPAGADTWNRNGPPYATGPIVMEAFGLTTERLPYVNLSDGGHFENLGLYEMVRRRCRYIVVSDAGCDPDFALEDLGNAVRKIGIDFGIPIRFIELQNLKPRPAGPEDSLSDEPYHSVGVIDYSAVDGDKAEPGIVLYVKASFHNCNESAGVKAYAKAHPAFPHEPTSDQWFDEAQFESYRSLGFEIMTMTLDSALENCPCTGIKTGEHTLKSLLEALRTKAEHVSCRAEDREPQSPEA